MKISILFDLAPTKILREKKNQSLILSDMVAMVFKEHCCSLGAEILKRKEQ